MSVAKFNMADLDALFKIKYEKLSENVYNSANVLLGRVKKSYKFTGSKLQITVPSSFAGGVGSGLLPTANKANYVAAEIEAKKVYARVDIDRETIKASQSSEGAFVQATKEVVKKAVESYMRNMSRILFGDGSGKLGGISGTPVGALVTISDATFNEANLEERDLVDITEIDGSGDETVLQAGLEIISVDVAAKTVTLSAAVSSVTSGSTLGSLVMQNSLGNDPMGLKGALLPESAGSKLYGIDRARRWSGSEIDKTSASGAAKQVSTALLNEMMLNIKKKSGKSPNLIICSFTQFEKILGIIDSNVQYNVETRAGLKGKNGAPLSFSGIQFMSIDGPVGVFPERFVEDDRIYFLNDSHIHIHHRPDFGWFDDDGTVLLRKADLDAYEARYGGYLNVYINPCFHGVIKGLEV
jgi:hypothetical protein